MVSCTEIPFDCQLPFHRTNEDYVEKKYFHLIYRVFLVIVYGVNKPMDRGPKQYQTGSL